jgi:hypothetical protein
MFFWKKLEILAMIPILLFVFRGCLALQPVSRAAVFAIGEKLEFFCVKRAREI